ncbi:hypothetical protein VP01_486g2 [Puccinia sorghi]|uniref:Uncharacterized protein n=1 Tax=Puccinia sorghi TaxID=27349 RepID=A0A0L6UMB3_9BASI|nr:hypothetical protein VP01_486g2 [Puccinia sorghi]
MCRKRFLFIAVHEMISVSQMGCGSHPFRKSFHIGSFNFPKNVFNSKSPTSLPVSRYRKFFQKFPILLVKMKIFTAAEYSILASFKIIHILELKHNSMSIHIIHSPLNTGSGINHFSEVSPSLFRSPCCINFLLSSPLQVLLPKVKATHTHCLARYKGSPLYLMRQFYFGLNKWTESVHWSVRNSSVFFEEHFILPSSSIKLRLTHIIFHFLSFSLLFLVPYLPYRRHILTKVTESRQRPCQEVLLQLSDCIPAFCRFHCTYWSCQSGPKKCISFWMRCHQGGSIGHPKFLNAKFCSLQAAQRWTEQNVNHRGNIDISQVFKILKSYSHFLYLKHNTLFINIMLRNLLINNFVSNIIQLNIKLIKYVLVSHRVLCYNIYNLYEVCYDCVKYSIIILPSIISSGLRIKNNHILLEFKELNNNKLYHIIIENLIKQCSYHVLNIPKCLRTSPGKHEDFHIISNALITPHELLGRDSETFFKIKRPCILWIFPQRIYQHPRISQLASSFTTHKYHHSSFAKVFLPLDKHYSSLQFHCLLFHIWTTPPQVLNNPPPVSIVTCKNYPYSLTVPAGRIQHEIWIYLPGSGREELSSSTVANCITITNLERNTCPRTSINTHSTTKCTLFTWLWEEGRSGGVQSMREADRLTKSGINFAMQLWLPCLKDKGWFNLVGSEEFQIDCCKENQTKTGRINKKEQLLEEREDKWGGRRLGKQKGCESLTDLYCSKLLEPNCLLQSRLREGKVKGWYLPRKEREGLCLQVREHEVNLWLLHKRNTLVNPQRRGVLSDHKENTREMNRNTYKTLHKQLTQDMQKVPLSFCCYSKNFARLYICKRVKFGWNPGWSMLHVCLFFPFMKPSYPPLTFKMMKLKFYHILPSTKENTDFSNFPTLITCCQKPPPLYFIHHSRIFQILLMKNNSSFQMLQSSFLPHLPHVNGWFGTILSVGIGNEIVIRCSKNLLALLYLKQGGKSRFHVGFFLLRKTGKGRIFLSDNTYKQGVFTIRNGTEVRSRDPKSWMDVCTDEPGTGKSEDSIGCQNLTNHMILFRWQDSEQSEDRIQMEYYYKLTCQYAPHHRKALFSKQLQGQAGWYHLIKNPLNFTSCLYDMGYILPLDYLKPH